MWQLLAFCPFLCVFFVNVCVCVSVCVAFTTLQSETLGMHTTRKHHYIQVALSLETVLDGRLEVCGQ